MGFAYELPLTVVQAAFLIAGSLYIFQCFFSHEERITSNNLSFSGAPAGSSGSSWIYVIPVSSNTIALGTVNYQIKSE